VIVCFILIVTVLAGLIRGWDVVVPLSSISHLYNDSGQVVHTHALDSVTKHHSLVLTKGLRCSVAGKLAKGIL